MKKLIYSVIIVLAAGCCGAEGGVIANKSKVIHITPSEVVVGMDEVVFECQGLNPNGSTFSIYGTLTVERGKYMIGQTYE